MTKEQLCEKLKNERAQGSQGASRFLNMQKQSLEPMDLSGWELSKIDFSWSDFHSVIFDGANLAGANLSNCNFETCSLRDANLKNADLRGSLMRRADLTGAHVEGTKFYRSVLEYAKMNGMTSDESTSFFRLYCPGTGPFLGYKKCCYDRLVQLLIPADAKRTSATANTCRCSKAKVLTIKSFDYTENYTEAWSLVDPNFYYRVGEWVEVKDFNEDRWMDSTTGIHFWMTREEAKKY